MLDQVSGTGMDPSFQIMFDFTEGTLKSFPIALGLSGALEAQGGLIPHTVKEFWTNCLMVLLSLTST